MTDELRERLYARARGDIGNDSLRTLAESLEDGKAAADRIGELEREKGWLREAAAEARKVSHQWCDQASAAEAENARLLTSLACCVNRLEAVQEWQDGDRSDIPNFKTTLSIARRRLAADQPQRSLSGQEQQVMHNALSASGTKREHPDIEARSAKADPNLLSGAPSQAPDRADMAHGPYRVKLQTARRAVVRRADGNEVHPTFWDLQAIKDCAFGPELTAIEIFPPTHNLCTDQHQRHLWCVPDGWEQMIPCLKAGREWWWPAGQFPCPRCPDEDAWACGHAAGVAEEHTRVEAARRESYRQGLEDAAAWWPIEMAPKDGTPVLLFARAAHATTPIRITGHYLEDYGWTNIQFSGYGKQVPLVPYCWQHLPPITRE